MFKRAPLIAAAAVTGLAALGLVIANGLGASRPAAPPPPVTVRVGYVTGLADATALEAADTGLIARDLVPNRVSLRAFATSAAESAALAAGRLDAAYATTSSPA